MKTKIVYYSKTGNIEKFIKKLNYDNTLSISKDLIIKEPFVLLVSTIKFGEVPIEFKKFLKNNSKNLIGTVISMTETSKHIDVFYLFDKGNSSLSEQLISLLF